MKHVLASAVAVAAVMVLTPAGAQDRPMARTSRMPKLRLVVGGKSAIFYLPLSVTERLGYFRQAGLELEIVDVQSGARTAVPGRRQRRDGRRHLRPHYPDAGQGAAGRGGHAIRALSGFVLATVASKSVPYRGPQSLKGLKIGVTSPGSSTHFMAAYMLVRTGSSPTTPRSSAPA